MTPTSGGMHRCPQILVHGIHVDMLLQQKFHNADVSIRSSYVKLNN